MLACSVTNQRRKETDLGLFEALFESEEEKKRKEQNGYWYEYPNAGGFREWIPPGPAYSKRYKRRRFAHGGVQREVAPVDDDATLIERW